MRRNRLTRTVRGIVEQLESRTLLSAAVAHSVQPFNTIVLQFGGATLDGVVQYDPSIPFVGGSPIVGATVFLDLNHDHTLDANDPNIITDTNGGFTFSGVAFDTEYWVEVIPLTGYHQSPPGYQVVSIPNSMSMSNAQNVVIYESNEAGISGILFSDNDQSGVYDPYIDTTLGGDTVYIDANQNGMLDGGELSTTTSAGGVFNLDVGPGVYQLRVIPRPGFVQDPPGFLTVTVGASGQAVANIGESNTSSLSGIVFTDVSGSGVFANGDTPVAGEEVDITAIGSNTSGYSASTITADDGSYTFTGLAAGQYRLSIFTGGAGSIEDNPGYIDVTVVTGQDLVQNIGEGAPASVSGIVYEDSNGDGMQDNGEPGLSDQVVYVDINNNGAYDTAGTGADGLPLLGAEPTTTTEPNGGFTIGNLGPGTYTVRLEYPDGTVATEPVANNNSYAFTVGSGQNATGKVFGFQTPDLAVSMVQLSTASVFGGVNQKAAFRVTDVGSLPAVGQISVDLYASTIQSFDLSTATQVGMTSMLTVDLQPGRFKLLRLKYVYPTTLLSGSYYVTAQLVTTVNDSNRVNNTATSALPITITQPVVDLNLAFLSQPPVAVFPGAATVFDLLLTNDGNVTSSSTLTFHIFLAPGNSIASGGTLARSISISGLKLKPNVPRVIHLALPFPGQVLGTEYPIITVDSGNPLGEINSTNNIVIPLAPTDFE